MVKTLALNAGARGSIPLWGTKIPCATRRAKKKEREREKGAGGNFEEEE